MKQFVVGMIGAIVGVIGMWFVYRPVGMWLMYVVSPNPMNAVFIYSDFWIMGIVAVLFGMLVAKGYEIYGHVHRD